MEEDHAVPVSGGHSGIILHQQLEKIMEEFDRCCRLTRQYGGDPNCMSIEGPTGAGKTRLAEELVQLRPPFAGPEGVVWPVFHFQLPAETTPKRVAIALLEALGDPTPRRDDPTIRVVHQINAVVGDAVVLDDFHHLLNLDTTRRRDAVSDLLKVMIKKTKKVFVIIGIEGRTAEILIHNPQLARLFSCSMQLRPFPLDLNAKQETYLAQIGEFDRFVRRATAQLNIEITHGLAREDFLRRMHSATDGVVGNTLNLLRYAKDLAASRQKPVDILILAEAYEQRMKVHLYDRGKVKNPFEVGKRKPPKAAE